MQRRRDRRARAASASPNALRVVESSLAPRSSRSRPQRGAVAARDDVERPARQALARVVLAHAMQHDAAGREPIAQLVGERAAALPLVGTERAALPLVGGDVVARGERRLAADGDVEPRGGERRVGAIAAASSSLQTSSVNGAVGRASWPRRAIVVENSTALAATSLVPSSGAACGGRRGRGERDVALAA